jgi:hypothetical protein
LHEIRERHSGRRETSTFPLGATYMKKVLIVAAAAGLTAIAACTPSTTNVNNNTEVVIANDVDVDVNSNVAVENAVAPIEANVVEANVSNAM